MKFALTLLAALPAMGFGAPVLPRQGGVAVTCGSNAYSAAQVNRAITNGIDDRASSSSYPHKYKYVATRPRPRHRRQEAWPELIDKHVISVFGDLTVTTKASISASTATARTRSSP
jgi:hypothetical protein